MSDEAKGYGEPWQAAGTTDGSLYNRTGNHIADLRDLDGAVLPWRQEMRIADRIIACVNACAGMADPVAEIQRLREIADTHAREELRRVRDL